MNLFEAVESLRIVEYTLNPTKKGRIKKTSEGIAWYGDDSEAYTAEAAAAFGADKSIEHILDSNSAEERQSTPPDYRPL